MYSPYVFADVSSRQPGFASVLDVALDVLRSERTTLELGDRKYALSTRLDKQQSISNQLASLVHYEAAALLPIYAS